MTVRYRCLLAAMGLGMSLPLPVMRAGDAVPAPLAIAPSADEQLASVIAERLKQGGQLRHYCIDVAVHAGTVTLIGRVTDEGQREEALRLARGIAGRQPVVDRLQLSGTVAQVQAEQVPPPVPAPREPAQMLPRAPTPTTNPAVEPMPMMMGAAPGPYDLATPKMPPYAWPTYAPYNNYSRVAYPQAYPYNAWPYIGPPYPFPKIPLGWREVKLEWHDGHWWFSKLGTSKDWWRLRYW